MIFMGSSALTDGYRLIGFETWAEPKPSDIEKLLRELVNKRQNAFLVIEEGCDKEESPMLDQVRAVGGHIVVCIVPPLNEADRFRTRIDERLRMMLGSNSMV